MNKRQTSLIQRNFEETPLNPQQGSYSKNIPDQAISKQIHLSFKLFVDQEQQIYTQKMKSSKSSKKPWSENQDKILRTLVLQNGPKNWSKIAKLIQSRKGKQCRQRWFNHLSYDVIKKEWTQQQQWLLFLLVQNFGTKWTKIKYHFPGRSDNDIKNHWNCKMKKKIQSFRKKVIKLFESPSQLEKEELFQKNLVYSLNKNKISRAIPLQQKIKTNMIVFAQFMRELNEQPSQQQEAQIYQSKRQILLQRKKMDEEAQLIFRNQMRNLCSQKKDLQNQSKRQIKCAQQPERQQCEPKWSQLEQKQSQENDENQQSEDKSQVNQRESWNVDVFAKQIHLQQSGFIKTQMKNYSNWNIFQQEDDSELF